MDNVITNYQLFPKWKKMEKNLYIDASHYIWRSTQRKTIVFLVLLCSIFSVYYVVNTSGLSRKRL